MVVVRIGSNGAGHFSGKKKSNAIELECETEHHKGCECVAEYEVYLGGRGDGSRRGYCTLMNP